MTTEATPITALVASLRVLRLCFRTHVGSLVPAEVPPAWTSALAQFPKLQMPQALAWLLRLVRDKCSFSTHHGPRAWMKIHHLAVVPGQMAKSAVLVIKLFSLHPKSALLYYTGMFWDSANHIYILLRYTTPGLLGSIRQRW